MKKTVMKLLSFVMVLSLLCGTFAMMATAASPTHLKLSMRLEKAQGVSDAVSGETSGENVYKLTISSDINQQPGNMQFGFTYDTAKFDIAWGSDTDGNFFTTPCNADNGFDAAHTWLGSFADKNAYSEDGVVATAGPKKKIYGLANPAAKSVMGCTMMDPTSEAYRTAMSYAGLSNDGTYGAVKVNMAPNADAAAKPTYLPYGQEDLISVYLIAKVPDISGAEFRFTMVDCAVNNNPVNVSKNRPGGAYKASVQSLGNYDEMTKNGTSYIYGNDVVAITTAHTYVRHDQSDNARIDLKTVANVSEAVFTILNNADTSVDTIRNIKSVGLVVTDGKFDKASATKAVQSGSADKQNIANANYQVGRTNYIYHDKAHNNYQFAAKINAPLEGLNLQYVVFVETNDGTVEFSAVKTVTQDMVNAVLK